MAELKYEITEHIGVLSENAKGWTKELNMVSWNEHEPKYDIREWLPTIQEWARALPLQQMTLLLSKTFSRELISTLLNNH